MTLEQIRSRLYARRQELLSMNVLVLAGGASSEREISLKSGHAVVDALAGRGFSTALAVISEQGIALDYFKALGPGNPPSEQSLSLDTQSSVASLVRHDVVFTMMHGNMGENGTWQGLLRLVGLPFVSADVKGSAIAMDKLLTKRIARTLGISTPRWWSGADLATIRSMIPAGVERLVAKPVDQGSSVGVAIFDNDDAGWHHAQAVCEGINRPMVEECISGRELTSGWIGHGTEPVGLPVVEIRPEQGFYDYRAKYTKGASQYICPAPLADETRKNIISDAGRIYRELELEPFARIDFILDESGRHWFLEANTLPGFTELSLLPMAAASVGMEYAELLETLMLLAVERQERQGAEL